jgi:prepilin-type N-terminal cleavage/methylation domain-containing protein
MVLRFFGPLRLRKRFPIGGKSGFTLLELLVVIAIIGITSGLSLPYLSADKLDLKVEGQRFMGHLRMARANAVNRGVHYRVSISPAAYQIERLEDDDEDGVWLAEATVVDLPVSAGLTLSSDADGVIEFDTRGFVIPPTGALLAAVEILTLDENASGKATVFEVWPSGQIVEQ